MEVWRVRRRLFASPIFLGAACLAGAEVLSELLDDRASTVRIVRSLLSILAVGGIGATAWSVTLPSAARRTVGWCAGPAVGGRGICRDARVGARALGRLRLSVQASTLVRGPASDRNVRYACCVAWRVLRHARCARIERTGSPRGSTPRRLDGPAGCRWLVFDVQLRLAGRVAVELARPLLDAKAGAPCPNGSRTRACSPGRRNPLGRSSGNAPGRLGGLYVSAVLDAGPRTSRGSSGRTSGVLRSDLYRGAVSPPTDLVCARPAHRARSVSCARFPRFGPLRLL
jgi:hypothetical protein